MRLEHRKLIYLASPYTHKEPEVRQNRFEQVCKATAFLARRGYFTYSPIVNTHNLAADHNMPVPFDFWREFDELMISKADYLVVLMLDGWKDSVGVTNEVAFAKRIGKQVFFADPNQLEYFALGGTHAASTSA